MDRRKATLRFVCAGLGLWMAMIGCGFLNTTSVNELRSEDQSIEIGSASSARIQIEFAAGQLVVGGGGGSLMNATFRYNVNDWKPKVEYSVNGNQGELLVSQEGKDFKLPVGGKVINDWNIRLNEAAPIDLDIKTGAGESELDLRTLDLTSLNVEVGAGSTSLDLSGDWDHDLSASVTGGVGDLSIKLPANMGVRVNLDRAIVSVTATGLKKDGDGYINQTYGTAPSTLTLELTAGVGSINLEVP